MSGEPAHRPVPALDDWVRTDFQTADLGDGRLDARLRRIAQALARKPNASIPQACKTWGLAKSVYRFVDNPKVSHAKILEPHATATWQRAGAHPTVLAIQDTTSLNYSHLQATDGLGTLGNESAARGLWVHTTIAVTPERLPLGLVHQAVWVRPPEESGKRAQRRLRDIEEKESVKWLHALRATTALQAAAPHARLIHVGDRESDIYELFVEALALQPPCDLLVRAARNRRVESSERTLWETLCAQPVQAEFDVVVPRKPGKRERTARLEVRYDSVLLRPPACKPHLPPVRLGAVYLNEPVAPPSEPPLSWMLLTTLPVRCVQDAQRVAQYYGVRPFIEVFHRTLKTGCRIEKLQLETVDRLTAALALYSIVAYRVLFLTMIGRAHPDGPCTVLFDDDEWQSLFCFVNRTRRPPDTPLTLAEAIRLVACLGGFLGRKQDGSPGAEVLWRGLRELSCIRFCWRTFGPHNSRHNRSPP